MRSARNNRHRQRGAIGLLAAATLAMLLLAVVLAVDSGRLWLEKRWLQQRADLAVLATSQRYCDGFSSIVTARTEIRTSLLQNGFDPDASTNTVTVALGSVTTTNYRRSFTDDSNDQAVHLLLTRKVPASLFAGGLIGGQVQLRAEATAQRDLLGTLSAGAQLANIDSTQSALLNPVLGALLGVPLSISAAGYNGVIQANLQFTHLLNALANSGVIVAAATPEDATNASLTFGTFLQVLQQALTYDGNLSTVASTIDGIRSATQSLPIAGRTLALSDILVLDGPYANSTQALAGRINVMTLLTAAVMAINRNQFVTANLAINTASNTLLKNLLGNTLNSQLVMRVIEPPTIAIGRFGFDGSGQARTLARTAQMELRLTLNLNLTTASGGFVASLVNLITSISGNIGISVVTARGDAWLDHVTQCPSLLSRHFLFAIGVNPQPTTLRIGKSTDTTLPAALTLNVLAGVASASVNVGANFTLAAAAAQTVNFDVDLAQSNSLPTPSISTGTDLASAMQTSLTTLGSSLASGITVNILGVPLVTITTTELASDLAGILAPVLQGVVQLTLVPILKLLGITIGTLDVRLLGIEEGYGRLLI